MWPPVDKQALHEPLSDKWGMLRDECRDGGIIYQAIVTVDCPDETAASGER